MSEAALREIIARIELTFGSDIDAWLSCFDEPMVLVAPAGTMTFVDHATARVHFLRVFEALRAAGFDSTTADRVDVRMLDDDIALVDARFTRRRADGSEMEKLAALYVCRRRDDAWLVATLVRHE
jgi:hypothetical protein